MLTVNAKLIYDQKNISIWLIPCQAFNNKEGVTTIPEMEVDLR